ncbi:MAG: Fpg/Nei family DNA glycosylase [Acidimicrobiaceae bacterium]|nr:Fpg/Nei family DNA glycosylase [Acidimicrobiaceae bacterium]
MPEGHTIHRIARDQFAALGHRPISVTSPQGRFAGGAALVDGAVLEGIDAWGKHLFYRFDGGHVIHVHLGLFGKFFADGVEGGGSAVGGAATLRQVRLRLAGPEAAFDLTGPTACELIDAPEVKAITDRLGPDPLRPGADAGRAWAKLARRRTPIGVAIMDQSVVAGVGNVFRAESLFVQGIHPDRPSATLERAEWDALWATLVKMLRAGLRTGRIVTVPRRDPASRDGRTRYVYKQEHCARCAMPIRRWNLAGRWAYGCETCQPPWPIN